MYSGYCHSPAFAKKTIRLQKNQKIISEKHAAIKHCHINVHLIWASLTGLTDGISKWSF